MYVHISRSGLISLVSTLQVSYKKIELCMIRWLHRRTVVSYSLLIQCTSDFHLWSQLCVLTPYPIHMVLESVAFKWNLFIFIVDKAIIDFIYWFLFPI